jgi:small subunit ribosomal protein S23
MNRWCLFNGTNFEQKKKLSNENGSHLSSNGWVADETFCVCVLVRFRLKLSMAYKAPPAELTKHVSRLLKGKLLKKPPTWLSAVKAVPPGPSIIRSQNPEVNITGQSTAEQQFIQANRPTVHTSIRHKQKNLKTKAPKPRQIVYPEDRLRRQFYKDHPFELQRPKLLVETTEGINRTDFSQLLLPGMHPAQVDGEA